MKIVLPATYSLADGIVADLNQILEIDQTRFQVRVVGIDKVHVCDKVAWVILGQATTSSQSRPRGVAPQKSKESVFLSMADYNDDFLPVFTYTDLNDMTTEELHEMYKRHVRGLNEMRRNPDLYWIDDIQVWECKVLQLMLFI